MRSPDTFGLKKNPEGERVKIGIPQDLIYNKSPGAAAAAAAAGGAIVRQSAAAGSARALASPPERLKLFPFFS